MKVLKENLGDVVVLTLKGEFDSFVTTAFGGEIQKVQDDGIDRIVLNMRLVKFVNSTALGAMIKARKQCRSQQGDLVVSQPSAVVREALESLGLDRLFSIFDEDELAIAELDHSGGIEMDGDSESAVMIHVPETTRPIVARLARLETEGMDCRVRGGGQAALVGGREVRVKFRLPLYRREFFDVSARLETIQTADDSTLLTLRFLRVSDEDRKGIEAFVRDMGELRRAAREET